MLGFRYMKAPPTRHVFHYVNGALKREGAGLSFYYFAPWSTLVSVPVGSADVPFVYNETTADFQAVTIQGQMSYRVTDPRKLAGLLDFTVGPANEYLSEDPQVLAQRLVHAAQILTRTVTQRMALAEVLVSTDRLVAEVFAGLRQAEAVTRMGVEVLGLSVLGIRPTPEMARALEAGTREGLQRQADEAIYSRRNAAVEQERRIKENELQTELAVEEKRRQIREAQMNADIAVEEKRSQLIDRRVSNDCKDADCKGYALRATLEPLKTVDWRTLMALWSGKVDSGLVIAQAFQELAQNAQKIGELNITPELLTSLVRNNQKG